MKIREKSFTDLAGFADIKDCKKLYNIRGGLAGVTCSGAYPQNNIQRDPNPNAEDSFPPIKNYEPPKHVGSFTVNK